MLSRTCRVWLWVSALFTVCVLICSVVAAFAVGLQWGIWAAAAGSLAVLAVLSPKAIILVFALNDLQYQQVRRIVARVYTIALILTLCLVAVSFITGPVGLTVFCAVCALWTALFWVMFKVASNG
jgi:hypothetical protein